jgi:hypothetical protein
MLADDVDRGLARAKALDTDRAAHLEEPGVDLLAHARRRHRHFDAALEARLASH